MINLLPPEEKKKIFSEKKEKLITIWGIVIFISLVSLTLVLLSIRFYILSGTDYQKIILEQTKKEKQTHEFTSLNNAILGYNGILAQLDFFYKKEVYFSRVLEAIIEVPSPDGIYLTNFSLARSGSGTVQVNISGISDTRDNLLTFRKNIEQQSRKDQGIKNPYFSPESWTSPKDAKFSLTFTYQNDKQ